MTNQAPFVGPGTLVVVVGGETVSRLVLVLVELMVVVEEQVSVVVIYMSLPAVAVVAYMWERALAVVVLEDQV